ncbi:MAG: hypothetical protein J5I41_09985 [Saprospiraceae bacterium]|nr:hypothetical protein [Saprospiraceae bacterium]
MVFFRQQEGYYGDRGIRFREVKYGTLKWNDGARKVTWALILLLSGGGLANAQSPNMWEVFAKVRFSDTYVREFRDILPVPEFGPAITVWDGKEISLTGYVIPATEAPGFEWIILSRYSFANCFFCGKAGVESIAEIRLKGKRPFFKNDHLYTFRGRLRLNKDDWNHLHFILEDAVLVR